jgi:hypothetical protein
MENPGLSFGLVDFVDSANNDFTNTSGFGAQGWTTSPKTYIPSAEAENALSNSCADDDSEPQSAPGRHAELYGHNLLRQEVLEKSLFFDEDDALETTENGDETEE